MSKYKQLNLEIRYQIKAMLETGNTANQIARKLGIHRSTVYREVARNSVQQIKGQDYLPMWAEHFAKSRKRLSVKYERLTEEIKQRIRKGICQLHWSPEQLVGRCKRFKILMVSIETIYQFIWEEKKQGGICYQYLKRKQKARRKRGSGNQTRGLIKDRIMIGQRPGIVDKRKRIGDWEIDTLVGKNHKSVLLCAAERKSRYTLLGKLPSKSMEDAGRSIIEMMNRSSRAIQTITSDNGKEFAAHQTIAQQLVVDYYFCNPYHSWERGTNENTIGLVRWYLPKQTDFNSVTIPHLIKIEYELNNRPRKVLGFKTPNEVFLNNFDQSVALIT